MTQLNISLPPPKDSPDFDGWLVQVAQYLRDYLGLYDSSSTIVAGANVSFIQAGTGATTRTGQDKMRDVISVKDFGAVGDGSTDDTTAIGNAIVASRFKSLYFPAGKYKITSVLDFDPAYSYSLYGDGYDPDAVYSSVIYNAGTGHAITCDDTGGTGNNNLFEMRNLVISGSSSSQNGIYLTRVHGAKLSNIWVTSHGYNGVLLYDCWSCKLDQVWSVQNGRDGIKIDRRGNQITLLNCVANGNSRSNGYANLRITGAGGYENLGIVVMGCDFTGAGSNPYTTVTESYNIVVQYTLGITFIGNYSETCITELFYSDSTVSGITLIGNYFQDGEVKVEYSSKATIIGNIFNYVVTATKLNLDAQIADQAIAIQNSYFNGATEDLSGSNFKNRLEVWNASAPGGSYTVGDICWHSAPVSGGNVGWIYCSDSGGVWKAFGTIA